MRKSHVFILLTALALVITCAGCKFFAPAKKNAQPPQAETPAVSKPSASPRVAMEIATTKLESLNKGKKEWVLTADKVQMNQWARKAKAKNIKCEFYDEDGNLYITMSCAGADVDMATNNLQFIGSVSAKSVKGETFYAEKLKFSGKDKLLIGSGFVKMTSGSSVIYGNKLIGAPAKRTIEIQGNVKADIKMKDFKK